LYNENPIISKWIADMYDQQVTETDDVAFLLSAIAAKSQRILEVCCGSGRILVPLAEAGHDVSGFDADEYMLAKIPFKAKGLANIHWLESDAVHDDWGEGFDIVVLAGNILYNIVSDMGYAQAQELFIQKAASSLKPGGHVYIEYQPGGHRIMQSEPSHSKEDERFVVWEGSDADGNHGRMILLGGGYDMATGLDSFTRRFELVLPTGETITQDIPSQKHFASLPQLHEWLGNAGFVIEWEYGDYQKSRVDCDSRAVIIYARKG